MPRQLRWTHAFFASMKPYFSELFGNPSSVHTFGQQAEAALESARESVAGCLNCQPKEVIFTSCGSESDNLALRGAAMAARQKSRRKPPANQPRRTPRGKPYRQAAG